MTLFHALAASADLIVCGPGAGPGQCSGPSGVAIDREDDLLYVADNGNEEIDVFDANDGSFLGSSAAGFVMNGIAVDNDPTSLAQHDVYVFDNTGNRVVKLRPTGSGSLELVKPFGEGQFALQADLDLGPGGVVYIADKTGAGNRRVQKFDHEGTEILECGSLEPVGQFGENLTGFAVDSAGSFYVASAGGRPVRKYDSSCAWLNTPPFDKFHESSNIQVLAVDAANELFVGDSTGSVDAGGETAIYEYDASGVMQRVVYGDGSLQKRPGALAIHSTPSGDIVAAEQAGGGRVVHVAFHLPGPVFPPSPGLTNANPIGNTHATLNTKINPEGKVATFHFEYIDDPSYDKDIEEGGDGFGEAKITSEKTAPLGTTPAFAPEFFRVSSPSEQIGCADPTEKLIKEGKCLTPERLYHFRAVAISADGGPRIGPESTFSAKSPFEILDTWASNVGFGSAEISALVNPLNIPAEGHFEYVDEATYQESGFADATTTAPIDFGLGEEPVVRTAQLHSLSADTTYRFRVFVTNFAADQHSEVGSFKTFPPPGPPLIDCINQDFRIGASALLPDCRAYELVSPVDKEGGEIEVRVNEEQISKAEIVQSAATVPVEGRGLTYSSYRAFGDAVSAPFSSQYLASRHPVGHPEEGWSNHGLSPPRGIPLSLLVQEPQFKAFSADLGLALVRSDTEPPLSPNAVAGFPNLYRRDNVSDSYEAICMVKAEGFYRKVQGTSSNWETVVFRTGAKLSNAASSAKLPSGEPIAQTYACRGDEVQVLSVLPPGQGGKASNGNSSAGTGTLGDWIHRHDNVHNAVSADAERIYWTDSGAQEVGPGRIHLRERPFAKGAECSAPGAPCTAAVSQAVGVPGADQAARFWTASADGAVAIFSFTSGPLDGNLYRFDAETKTTSQIAEGVTGVAGWSENAERVYVVSTKELAPGGMEGKPNLYLHEVGGGMELVAALPGGTEAITRCGVDMTSPFERCTRVSADGSRIVFVSSDPLTGYDNRDAQNGEPDAEVFFYDTEANDGDEKLICISCNPSGGRPAGQEIEFYGGHVSLIAARIPGWMHSLYAPRVLSADGRRLFFESFDALVPTDTNDAQDVYEWEEAGKGDCDVEDAHYFSQNGGCLALISSGRSPRDSYFVDASADGSDVFFKTAASLLPQDPGLVDIYDARIDGGFSIQSEPRPPCEGEGCQSPPAPPQPSSPTSMGFRGKGDLSEKGVKPRCPKGKRKAKRHNGTARCPRKQRKPKGHRRGRSRR